MWSGRDARIRMKEERLAKVWEKLAAVQASHSQHEAFQLLSATFREVEDELTDIPYAPENWQTDGRMYPPQEDSARDVPKETISSATEVVAITHTFARMGRLKSVIWRELSCSQSPALTDLVSS